MDVLNFKILVLIGKNSRKTSIKNMSYQIFLLTFILIGIMELQEK